MSDPIAALATLRGELREEKEYASALHESKADAERILSKKILELSEAQKRIAELGDQLSELKQGWYCTNCGLISAGEPSEPCPRCNGAIWEQQS